MLEMKDGKKILTTPISAEDLADIHIGALIVRIPERKVPIHQNPM